MEGCDTLLMVGTSFPYSEWLPEEGQARCVEIDVDASRIGIRYPVEVPLVGDAKETLRALIPHLERKDDRSWRERIEREVAEWWRVVEDQAMVEGEPMNPQRVVWELNAHLPDGAIVTADSGSSTNWWARQLKLRRGMMASLSGTLATMGPGVPYAIAAKFCHPHRPAVALVGDGAMQMCGMAELITAKKYYKQWADPRLVVLVLNNRDLNQVTWEQRALQGDPMNPMTQRIPDVRYAEFAELIGLAGVRVEQPEDIGDAWRQAFAADRPFVIDAVCDPNVPPLPPHIRADQARALVAALRKGDPEARGVISQSFKAKILEFLPGR
jgi:pyruvate dehydrogenase (quinone)